MDKRIIVSKENGGDFKSVEDAIKSIHEKNKEWIEIFVRNGIYHEKLFIEKSFIKLIGESAYKTIITFNDYAKKKYSDGKNYGTFNSYTVFIGSDNVIVENITFENSSGSGDEFGQAIACYSDGDKHSFKNCRFLGSQDTLFIGPLPPSPIIPGGFFGPREFAERIVGRHYFENCFIKGDIDFIFGSGSAFFKNCEIYSINWDKEVNGFITAPSTPQGEKYGFVFYKCRLTGDARKESVFLGRPWREYAKCVFIECIMGEHIKKEGWDDWDKKDAQSKSFFGEYKNFGPGATIENRVNWSKVLSEDEAGKILLIEKFYLD